jgi:hypothetical protein
MYESEKSRSAKKGAKNQGAQKKSAKNQGTQKRVQKIKERESTSAKA